jgi:hypothetical protein
MGEQAGSDMLRPSNQSKEQIQSPGDGETLQQSWIDTGKQPQGKVETDKEKVADKPPRDLRNAMLTLYAWHKGTEDATRDLQKICDDAHYRGEQVQDVYEELTVESLGTVEWPAMVRVRDHLGVDSVHEYVIHVGDTNPALMLALEQRLRSRLQRDYGRKWQLHANMGTRGESAPHLPPPGRRW